MFSFHVLGRGGGQSSMGYCVFSYVLFRVGSCLLLHVESYFLRRDLWRGGGGTLFLRDLFHR